MTAFTVWKFDSPGGAEQGAVRLKNAAGDGLVTILDYAVVSWPEGASHPDTKHGRNDERRGAGWGALWGILAGSLFFVPVIGGVIGAGLGAIHKATQDVGITKEQLETIRTEITEGTSALFAVTEQGDLDRLGERFTGLHSTLVTTNLTDEERRILLETFGS